MERETVGIFFRNFLGILKCGKNEERGVKEVILTCLVGHRYL